MDHKFNNIRLLCLVGFLVIFLAILGINQGIAYAQTDTPTFEPVWKTSTPEPTNYYDCPEKDQMEGYGTETPSVSWMNRCSFCLNTQEYEERTATIHPTLEGTPGTLAPTYTPLVTPQPTPTQVNDWWWQKEYDVRYTYTGGIGEFRTGFTGVEGEPLIQAVVFRVYKGCPAGGNTHIGQGRKYNEFWVERIKTLAPVCGEVVKEWWWQMGSAPYVDVVEQVELRYPELIGVPYKLANEDMKSKVYYATGIQAFQNNAIGTYVDYEVWYLHYGYLEVPTPTPSATPTIVPGGYCNSIDPAPEYGTDPFDAEGIFKIPIPELGSSICQVLMPEFTIPITWLNLIPGVEFENDLEFPGMTLCVRALYLGTLVLMNLNIDLDFYAVLVGAMMILRKVLRS